MQSTMLRRRVRGLTLIEMLVALALLAVLASLAVPSFGGMLTRHRLKSAADSLALDLAELRFEAARRGVSLYLQTTPGRDWCYALATAPGCDCRVVQSCQIKAVSAREHPGITLLQAQNLHFEPTVVAGMARRSALLQATDGSQLLVGLSALGRPSVCAPQSPVPGYTRC